MIQRITICLLIIGLNQGLFVQSVASQRMSENMPIPAACACEPESCMCPPGSGCEHNQPPQEESKGSSVCRLNADRRQVIFHSAWGWDVPVLAYHSGSFMPYPLYSRLEFLLTDFASQPYLAPPDKPPQALIT